MTNAQFSAAYVKAMQWETPVVIDENLSLHYPACTYTFSDRQVLALAPDVEAAREQFDGRESLDAVLETLFDLSQVRVTRESVIGFYAALAQIGEDLPPVEDAGALNDLLDAMEREERLRAEITVEDDLTCGIAVDGRLAAAAGAVVQGGLADIAVAVHPAWRAQGLGARVTAALIRRIQREGYIAVYRVEAVNLPSVRLARRLGLKRGFLMEGALVEFPDD